MKISKVSKEILVRGLEDWVHMPEVNWVVGYVEPGQDEERTRRLSLAAIAELVSAGLAELGVVTPEGFTPWDTDARTSLARVEREWTDTPKIPGEIGWLRNTAAGIEVAQGIIRAREANKAE